MEREKGEGRGGKGGREGGEKEGGRKGREEGRSEGGRVCKRSCQTVGERRAAPPHCPPSPVSLDMAAWASESVVWMVTPDLGENGAT